MHLGLLIRFLRIVIAICVFAILLQKFGIQVGAFVSGVSDWRCIAIAACVPVFISSSISANRWRLFLRINGINERILMLWRIGLISLFQGFLLPGSQGGDLIRIYHIEKRHPNMFGIAGSTVFVERLIGLILLCGFSLLALPFAGASEDFMALGAVVLTMNVLVWLGLGVVMSRKLHGYYAQHDFRSAVLAKLVNYIERFHFAVISFPYQKVLSASIFLICCFQISLVFVVYLVFLAYGYDLPFVQHLAIYPVVAVLSMIPVTVAGIGVREGLFIYFYGLLGVPANVAIGASVLSFILMILLPAAFGGLFVLGESISGRAINK
jgi:glycosyltransferase 2 family protein